MSDAKLTGSAPVLLVRDVLKSGVYFRDKLGFADLSFYGDPSNFCMARRDGLTVMLAQLDPARTMEPYWKIVPSMWNIYFWTDDVEALYTEFQARGAIIDYTLGVKDYGVKEFGVQDLDGHDIAFGQVLR